MSQNSPSAQDPQPFSERLVPERVYASTPRMGRVLVDRLWPRGVSKEKASLDAWAKALAPSDALRREFHGGALDWEQFCQRYRAELDASAESPEVQAALEELSALLVRGPVALLTSTKTLEQCHPLVLKDWLEGKI